MLAQSFISADELGITEPQRAALQKVLVLLETEHMSLMADLASTRYVYDSDRSMKFTGHFNMTSWVGTNTCGTVACIGGSAELIAGEAIFGGPDNDGDGWPASLKRLFFPEGAIGAWEATPTQAARALRSYLTTGDAKWAEAVA